MGQIVGTKAKPKRANLNALSQVGIPALGEYVLVSSDNSMSADGQGNFDCYIKGNGSDAATALLLQRINPSDIVDDEIIYTDRLYQNAATIINVDVQIGDRVTVVVPSGVTWSLYSVAGPNDTGTRTQIVNNKTFTEYSWTASVAAQSFRFWCYVGSGTANISVVRGLPLSDYIQGLSSDIADLSARIGDIYSSQDETVTQTITIPPTSNVFVECELFVGQAIMVTPKTTLSGYGIGIYAVNILYNNEFKDVKTFYRNGTTLRHFASDVEADALRIYNYMSTAIVVEVTYTQKNVSVLGKIDAIPYSVKDKNFINISNSTFESQSSAIIGFSNCAGKDYSIKAIQISLSGVSVGNTITAYIGQIDQRGNLVISREALFSVSSIDANVVTLTPNELTIIPATECLFISCNNWLSCTLSANSVYGALYAYDPTTHAVTARTDHVVPSVYVVTGNLIMENDFADKRSIDELQSQVDTNAINIAKAHIVTDSATGEKYEIKVTNGVLHASLVTYQKVLFIGNSFTLHNTINDRWWGDGRGMAASVDAAQYTEQIMVGLGGNPTYERVGGYYFETGYSADYNFDYLGNYKPYIQVGCKVLGELSNDFDLIIVQLGENASYSATMQASWEALFAYLKNKFTQARIVQLIGWYNAEKYNAISAACSAKGVDIVNCSTDTNTGKYSAGDYVTGNDGTYHAAQSIIINHPSDVGFNKIAHSLLNAVGVATTYVDGLLHDVTINQASGGTISVPYTKWVAGGILTIRVNGTLSALSVTANGTPITPVQRDSTHWTIVMPSSDIIITPTWS